VSVANRDISRELVSRGLLPADCRLLEIVITVDGAAVMRYEQYVSADRLGGFADALRAVADMASAPPPLP